jgi:Rrf2 family protein
MAANSRFAVAVHVLTALAWTRGTQTSEALAESVNTNPVVVRRILRRLAESGVVHAQPGRRGGFELAMPPRAIRLDSVYRAVEGEGLFAVHGNREVKGCPVSCGIKGVLRDLFTEAEGAALSSLGNSSLSDVIERIAVGSPSG